MKNAMEIYKKYIADLSETGGRMKIEIMETSANSNNFALLEDLKAGEGYHLAMIDFYSNVQLIRFYNKSEKAEAYRAFTALSFKSSEILRP